MSFCRNCGKQLTEGAAFCTGCGTAVDPVKAQQPAYAQPQQPVYSQPPAYAPVQPARPVANLKTNRSMVMVLLLSFFTFGIYALIYYSSISSDVNLICSRYDGKRTMHYCILVFLVSPFTFGLATYFWFNNMTNRVGAEIQRRGLNVSFSATDYWLWCVLGSFFVIGPFIYLHKEAEALNALCAHYNQYG